MKILCFADTRFPIERANGVQTMATCHALAERGHQVRLVVRPDTTVPARDPFAFYDLPPCPRLRVEPLAGPRHARARRAQFLLAAMRRAVTSQADLIFTRDLGLAAFLLQLPAGRRPPLVYESHGVSVVVAAEMPRLLGNPALQPSAQKLRRLDRREDRTWRRAAAYVTITQALADDLTQRYGARDRLFVIPDAARPRTSTAPAAGGGPLAAYAGHLYPWKGVDVLVHALTLTPRVRGLIVGGHPAEPDFARVEGLVRELRLTDRVEMAGMVSPAEVPGLLGCASILVLPNARSTISERYTSPLKLFEYLALGRAIVASDLPAIREVLQHEENALLVPPGDAPALAAAIARLADDPALAARLGAAARACALTHTWERRAQQLEAAFESAVAR